MVVIGVQCVACAKLTMGESRGRGENVLAWSFSIRPMLKTGNEELIFEISKEVSVCVEEALTVSCLRRKSGNVMARLQTQEDSETVSCI